MRDYRVGDIPVPLYRLIQKLGQGGFGAVWKAEGPGGTECALKFLSLGNNQGLREYRSIKLLKNVRHPHLAPLSAFWLKDGNNNLLGEGTQDTFEFQQQGCELIIAMGLGESSLADRLEEMQKSGMPGIPIEELLHYMSQSADAIDYLNRPIHKLDSGTPAALRHGDIKPANILVVGGGVWVCDFGLAGLLGGDIRATAGQPMFTPAYAAPEIVNYRGASQTSDQYSLAVSYVEMRTGRLPYDADSKDAVVAMISIGDVYIDFLSAIEQPILKRALAFKPDDRFPNCSEFVRALESVLKPRKSSPSTIMQKPPLAEELFARGMEPVPSYKLEKCLGKGGYGEVWLALGPGKTKVALKIVKDLSGIKGKQEWAALEAIKDELDHPHLMKMQAFWLLDAWGQVIPDEEHGKADSPKPAYLIILTELAAKNLMQRLDECKSQGQNGIPVKELLECMRQAAKALDYLNTTRHSFGEREGSIVHRDIKPENILLTRSGDVKVCDFGLAKMMEGVFSNVSTNSQGMTPYYAAPELLRKKLTRWTDQYSLAITYYQLRTGRLPIDTSLSHWEQIQRLGMSQLELSGLPEGERAVIARATTLEPTERFPSCTEMVAGLFSSVGLSLPDYSAVDAFDLPHAPILAEEEPTKQPSSQTTPYSPVDSPPAIAAQAEDPFRSTATQERKEKVAKPKELKRAGLMETHGPAAAEVRDTPGPNAAKSRGAKSSGDIFLPQDVRDNFEQAARTPAKDDSVWNSGAAPVKQQSTPTWKGPSTTAQAPVKSQPAADWRTQYAQAAAGTSTGKSSVGKILGTLIVLGLLVAGGVYGYKYLPVGNGEDPKKPPITPPIVPPAEVAELEALMKEPKPSESQLESGQKLIDAIKSKSKEHFDKLKSPYDDWDKKGKQYHATMSRDQKIAKLKEDLNKDGLTKDELISLRNEIEEKVTRSASEYSDLIQRWNRTKTESGRRLRDKIKDRVLKMAEKDPDTAAILNGLLELQGWWLTDSEADLGQVKVLSILAKARGNDETAGLNEAIEATPTSPYFTALFKEAVRIAKPADGKALMKRLAAKADQLPQADREVVFAAYGPSLIANVQSALKLDPANWKMLKAACDDAKPVVPNDPWVAVASAEVLATQEPKDLTKAASLVKSATLAQPYRQYVEAIVSASDDAAGAADKLVAVYPAKGNADPVVNIAARREVASQLLASAMKAKLKETRNPFEFPFEADDAEKVSRWIDTVTRINPSNQEALIYATLVAAIGPKPNPEQVKNLLQQLSKSWPNDKTAGSFAPILNLLRAESLAGSNAPAERVDALGIYCDTLEKLRLADDRLREKAAMKKAQTYVDRAIDFGKQMKQTNNATPAAMSRLAQLYGLRAEWINSNRIDWGFDNEEAAWAACLSDYKSALGLVGDGFDKAGYLAGRIYFDYKLKKIDEQDAELAAESARGMAPNNPRPHGLLATLKMKRAGTLIDKDRAGCNALYDTALTHLETAIKLSKPPIDNLRKAIFLDNAARICRHLATDGIRETENREKVEKYETEAAELRVFDDALGWSSRGRSLEDRAWPRGDRSLYPSAISAFDRAIGHEPKAQFYMDRGRITLRCVIYGGRNWSDLSKARADLDRAIKHPDATPLTKAEAWYFMSQLESIDRKLKPSAEAFQKFLSTVPADATSYKLAFSTYRGYDLAVEMEWLKENRKEIPAELGKEMESIAGKLPETGKFTAAWLRGTAKANEKSATPKAAADVFLKSLPTDFPKVDGLKLTPAELKDQFAWSRGLPLFGWLTLYLQSTDIDEKGIVKPAQLVELANALSELVNAPNNQDVWLRASGMAVAGKAHIVAASQAGTLPAQEQVYREQAIALLREAVDLLHPQFPTTWRWRQDLARELARSVNRPNMTSSEKKKRLEEARNLYMQAKDEAPSDARSVIIDELQRLSRG